MPNKRLLIIAFHFPPLQGSSALHRTLSLVRHLPACGWDVSVLTASPKAYGKIHADNLALIPENTQVIRAPAIDASRHLSVRGWYPRLLAVPDKFQSWIGSGAIAGLLQCRRERPDIILSTFPVASAHYIGWILHKVTRIPWVIDFRDPMAQDDYPADIRQRRLLHKLERRFVKGAERVFVTTAGTHRLYANRYPDLPARHLCLVPNGYDETMFTESPETPFKHKDKITLLHSGSLYKSERDPTYLFKALAQLKVENPALMNRVEIMFRGNMATEYFQKLVSQHNIGSIVSFGEAIAYRKAISEMLSANGLLILQASNCNDQIPAKVYEYMRTGQPILALTDPVGDTARLLASCGVTSIAKLDDTEAIKALLKRFFGGSTVGCTVGSDCDVAQFSRKRVAKRVSEILAEITV